MPPLSSIALFMASAFVLLITPGPAVLYIVARSIDQGRLAGIVSALGIGTGALVHTAAAALGLSALLVSSALAFNVVRYVGAAYLVYLGIQKFREHTSPVQITDQPPKKLSRIYSQGVIVNVLNPKAALFFFAFLPQFVDPANGSVTTQILLLGFIFVTMALFSDSTYALLAGTIGHWLRNSRRFMQGQRYFAGTVYLALGITTALAGSDK
jgi:threonine/homoserine/homoserine lactone efflux protein